MGTIVIKGHIDEQWQEWFEDLSIVHCKNGNTVLKGDIKDQACLYKILKKISALGLVLVSVHMEDSQNHL